MLCFVGLVPLIGKEFEIMYLTFWQGKKCLLVHYKDKMISVFDVDLNTYQMIDLYSDVKKLAME